MNDREKAVMTASNRRIETPETRRLLDYFIGDIVQIKADGGDYAGEVGIIIGIRAFIYDRDGCGDLAYRIKLSDKTSVEVSGGRMNFIRHDDSKVYRSEL